jgi:2-oxoacid:acceptor oxidoreductase gamma subunit (pyruvate/2-ketoisovalerate family)
MNKDTIDIRWHGRGGQGAITAAKIVAKAMFQSGYPGVVMVPTFGTERRGAPVFTSLKISRSKIFDLSPIDKPDVIVVLDHLLLEEGNIVEGIKEGGIIVINSPCTIDDYRLDGRKVAISNVTALALQAGLPEGMISSGIIGAFSKATGIIDMELLLNAIREEFSDRRPEENAKAALLAFKNTLIGG